jgi:hypothetical protein
MSQKTENYLIDIGREILLMARAAQSSAKSTNDSFEKGRQAACYEILSLMKQQADSFGLDEEAVGLKGVNIEQLLS